MLFAARCRWRCDDPSEQPIERHAVARALAICEEPFFALHELEQHEEPVAVLERRDELEDERVQPARPLSCASSNILLSDQLLATIRLVQRLERVHLARVFALCSARSRRRARERERARAPHSGAAAENFARRKLFATR